MENSELLTEETIPTEEATVQEAGSEAEDVSQKAAEEGAESTNDTAAEEDEKQDTAQEEPFTIRYMHEDLNLSRDEAKRFAQLGKHYEENVKETIDNLDYLATLQGKSVKELVTELVNGVENKYREELTLNLGEDNPLVEEMLELRRSKNQKAYETAKAERTAQEQQATEEAQKRVTLKLAEQFEALRETFPEYDTVEKVPDTVIKRAMQSGDLEKEMLRYHLNEVKKIEAAKASQEKNKNQNVGSVKSEQHESGIMDAFFQGLRSR